MEVAETKFIDHLRAEKMCFCETQEAIANRQVERKIQIRLADRAAERGSQTTGAKWELRAEVGKEESSRKLIVAAIEVAVVVDRKLVVGIFPRFAENKSSSDWIGVRK